MKYNQPGRTGLFVSELCLGTMPLGGNANAGIGSSIGAVAQEEANQLIARALTGTSERRKSVPIFLEAISVTGPTEIWVEAMRPMGQGFRVEVSSKANGLPATALRKKEHHLMWCGAGITQLMLNKVWS